MKKRYLFYSFCIWLLTSAYAAQISSKKTLHKLFETFDKDKDKKITVEDSIPPSSAFTYESNPPITVKGTYYLSNLAQELKLSLLTNKPVESRHIFENPVERISRSIRERYWDGLTRKIDATTIDQVLRDPKVPSLKKYLYVSHDDEDTYRFYKNLKRKDLEVVKLPPLIEPGFIASLNGKQGLLALGMKNGEGIPYVVPGGRFNEMYGWDSYFHVLGTIADDRLDLAKGMVDNFVYEIDNYGKILNANRTYYLSRSQPPFLTSMILEVHKKLKKNEETSRWLSHALRAAIKEYKTVWMNSERLTETGLSRYAGFDKGIPPEVEPGHFDHILIPYSKRHKMSVEELTQKFNEGKITDPKLLDFFHQDRAMRESGHDTTYRWRVGRKDRTSDFVTIDLNSLLYKYELDIAYLIQKYYGGKFDGESGAVYRDLAQKRKELIRKYLWDEKAGMFFDYNFVLKKRSDYISATTFYPLWASTDHSYQDNILSKDEAKKLVMNALRALEEEGGLAATAKDSLLKVENRNVERQWDYPFGWAPHQILAWKGLAHYGFHSEVDKLAYKWLYMITKNARDYNGTIPEKYNVVTLSHKVFAEYGNVGTKFAYITKEGFGWMNASYQLGLKLLTPASVKKLKKLSPQ